jgi:2-succinyl-5-enolpyruvyl-6-hydroxy-3-cyclohexene-1-carboxylate synthase
VPGRERGAPWVTVAHPPAARLPNGLPARSVIVAGAGAPSGLPELAAATSTPLLADPMSGARRGAAAIAHYDLLLRSQRFCCEHAPAHVLRVGELPTSKPLRTWLASLDVPQTAVDPDGAWQDPAGVVSQRTVGVGDGAAGDAEWLRAWRECDAAAAGAIAATLGPGLSEPAVAAGLYEWLPPDATLFVASSMPVRDVEEFCAVGDAPPVTLSNRGTNGIDGTVSSAFGAAAVAGGPVVLLIGDVALAYDVGGLLAARRLGLSLTIVLVNNDGGGIFHFLPVSGEADAFEEHVATPHGLDFAHAAALYGCGFERPSSVADLRAAVERSLAADGVQIIEVRTDRAENLALHRQVAAAVVSRLGG